MAESTSSAASLSTDGHCPMSSASGSSNWPTTASGPATSPDSSESPTDASPRYYPGKQRAVSFFIYDVLFYINIGPSVRPLELTMGKTFCFSDEEASSSFSPEFERSINRSMLDSLLNLYKHCCQGGSFLAHRRWETYTNELLVIRRTWLNPVKTM